MQNLATPDAENYQRVDTAVLAELALAGIASQGLEFLRKTNGEVPTRYVGELCGWGFRRAWRYWVAEGPGIPPDKAEEFHKAWGRAVRVDGNCACPSPLEWHKGFAVGMYHIDSQDGLNAFAELLRSICTDPEPRRAIVSESTEVISPLGAEMVAGLGKLCEQVESGEIDLGPRRPDPMSETTADREWLKIQEAKSAVKRSYPNGMWYPGGAQGRPWPWGDDKESPLIGYNDNDGLISFRRWSVDDWDLVGWWASPSDLLPPSIATEGVPIAGDREYECLHSVSLKEVSRRLVGMARDHKKTKIELARVTAEAEMLRRERDRLIEAWPDDEGDGGKPIKDWTDVNGKWRAHSLRNGRREQFDTRTEAVRFAAGLDEPKEVAGDR